MHFFKFLMSLNFFISVAEHPVCNWHKSTEHIWVIT